MTTNADRLKRKRERLLQEVQRIDRALADPEEGRPTPRRSLREIVLDMLEDAGVMLHSRTLSQLVRARYDREIKSTRFGTLASDEEKAYRAGRPRSVFLCHGLTHDRGEPIKRLWARSDWDLEDRLVASGTGRVIFLRTAVWLIGLAEEGTTAWARPELLQYLAADAARDLGFAVRKGDRSFARWRKAAERELERLAPGDEEARREAAERLEGRLKSDQRLFGASEDLTVLPGTIGPWRGVGDDEPAR